MDQATRNPVLEHLEAVTGEWETEATHSALPDTVVRGRATFEWLEGGFFLIWRSRNDHPDFPDGIAILGCADSGEGSTAGCSVHSFDSRGVSRVARLSAEPGVWRLWWDSPEFAVRSTATIGDDGNTMTVATELSTDGSTWESDLRVTYRRVGRG